MYCGYCTNIKEKFVPGDMYRVIWDGQAYDRIAMIFDEGYCCIGDIHGVEYGILSEPFCMVTYNLESGGNVLMIITEDDSAYHEVSIYHCNVVEKVIDPECFPVLYEGTKRWDLMDLISQFLLALVNGGNYYGFRTTNLPSDYSLEPDPYNTFQTHIICEITV